MEFQLDLTNKNLPELQFSLLMLTLQVHIGLVFSVVISILCALGTELADVHIPQDTCALSPATQGPAALLKWRLGVGVRSMDRIGLSEG